MNERSTLYLNEIFFKPRNFFSSNCLWISCVMYSYVIFLYTINFFSMLFLSSQRLFVTQTKRKHTIWSIRFRVIICASESRLVNSKRILVVYISLETKQLFPLGWWFWYILDSFLGLSYHGPAPTTQSLQLCTLFHCCFFIASVVRA